VRNFAHTCPAAHVPASFNQPNFGGRCLLPSRARARERRCYPQSIAFSLPSRARAREPEDRLRNFSQTLPGVRILFAPFGRVAFQTRPCYRDCIRARGGDEFGLVAFETRARLPDEHVSGDELGPSAFQMPKGCIRARSGDEFGPLAFETRVKREDGRGGDEALNSAEGLFRTVNAAPLKSRFKRDLMRRASGRAPSVLDQKSSGSPSSNPSAAGSGLACRCMGALLGGCSGCCMARRFLVTW
jgi:hypothetical protein